MFLRHLNLHRTDSRRKIDIKTKNIKLTNKKQTNKVNCKFVTADKAESKTEPTDRTGILKPLAALTVMGGGETQFCGKER